MPFQNILTDLLILSLFGAAIYVLSYLPQRREFKRRQQFTAQVEVGTQVTTFGGLIGTVKKVDSEQGLITVEIAEGVEVQMLAAAVMGEFNQEAVAEGAQKALKD